jgi:hypothetical protein
VLLLILIVGSTVKHYRTRHPRPIAAPVPPAAALESADY